MLFALAYGHSPFELNQNDQGGSIALAVMNAQYKHPAGSAYSQGMRDLIDCTLKADPADRPNIHQVSFAVVLAFYSKVFTAFGLAH